MGPHLPPDHFSGTVSSASTVKKSEPYVEKVGPHLPPDHVLRTVSSASRTFTCEEAEMIVKNEVDDYLEIGPQLASNSAVDLTNTDLSTDCNTVTDSSSKYISMSHSLKNGPGDASSSTAEEESWEMSLKIIERQFKGLSPDIGEESPDSTVRKGETSSENSVPCQTSSETVVSLCFTF